MERGRGHPATDDRGAAARRSDRHRIAATGDRSAAQRRPRLPAGRDGGRDARLEPGSPRPHGRANAGRSERPDRRQGQRRQDRQPGQGAGVNRPPDGTAGNAGQRAIND